MSFFNSLLSVTNEIPFEFGDLSDLYPSETYAQITARRQANWDLLKSTCNTLKVTGRVMTLPGRRIEFYRPVNDQIQFLDTQSLKMFNQGTEMVFYPFAFRAETHYYPFNFQYGSSADVRNTTIACAQKQGKLETYNVVLKKGGNLKLIEITESVRSGFWTDLQVGNTIYYTDQPSDLAESRIVQSFDSAAKTITVTVDIGSGIAVDATGIMCRNFNEDISETDYNTYGEFWIMNTARGQDGFHHIPGTSSGNFANFNFVNTLFQNWWNGVQISSGNFHVTVDNLQFDNCGVALAAFVQSQINGQSITGTNILFTENGYVGVGQISSDISMIYGAGGYIHPTVIVDLDLLECYDNYANGFRQYSSSIETQTPSYTTRIRQLLASGNGEYDFYASNCMPVIIEYVDADDIRIGGTITINEGIVTTTLNGNVLLQPPPGTVVTWIFNNLQFSGQMLTAYDIPTEALHEIYFNDCTFFVNEYGVLTHMLQLHASSKYLELNDCLLQKNPIANVPTYVPGQAIPVGNDCSYLFYHSGKEVVINNLVTDGLKGGLILHGPNTHIIPPTNTYPVRINDSWIKLSRLISAGPLTGDFYRTDMIGGDRSNIEAFNYNYVGYYIPMDFTNKSGVLSGVNIATSSQPLYAGGNFSVTNVLYTDYDHDEYYVNAGTINHICLRTWGGTTSISSAATFTGSITIHAVGGNVVINGWNAGTNPYGNVESNVTIPAGTSLTFTCNNKRTFSTSANTVVNNDLLAVGNGATRQYAGILDNYVLANTTFTVTAGAVTGTAGPDGIITGVGIDSGYVDYWTGTYYVLFTSNVVNAVNIEADYEIYTNWRVMGVYEF